MNELQIGVILDKDGSTWNDMTGVRTINESRLNEISVIENSLVMGLLSKYRMG